MYKESKIRRKQKEHSEKMSKLGKLGNEIKRDLIRKRGGELKVKGGCITYGCLGRHRIELMACDDPDHFWIRVDGELRRPRTERGFKRIVSEWISKRK